MRKRQSAAGLRLRFCCLRKNSEVKGRLQCDRTYRGSVVAEWLCLERSHLPEPRGGQAARWTRVVDYVEEVGGLGTEGEGVAVSRASPAHSHGAATHAARATSAAATTARATATTTVPISTIVIAGLWCSACSLAEAEGAEEAKVDSRVRLAGAVVDGHWGQVVIRIGPTKVGSNGAVPAATVHKVRPCVVHRGAIGIETAGNVVRRSGPGDDERARGEGIRQLNAPAEDSELTVCEGGTAVVDPRIRVAGGDEPGAGRIGVCKVQRVEPEQRHMPQGGSCVNQKLVLPIDGARLELEVIDWSTDREWTTGSGSVQEIALQELMNATGIEVVHRERANAAELLVKTNGSLQSVRAAGARSQPGDAEAAGCH